MASVINEHTQFVDSGGRPVVNGFLYFGTVDTDPVASPISIYSDRKLTTPLANPQRTDANGRSINKVWLDGKYSFRLSDVNNVQLYEELDNGDETLIGSTVLGNVQGGNTITATASPTITAYVDKQLYIFTVAQVNTGPVTLNIDSLGAKSVVKNGQMAIQAGEFKAEAVVIVVYNEALDHFDWVNQTQPVFGYSTENAAFTVLETNRAFVFDCTATLTSSLTAAATLGEGFIFTIKANGGDVTIDPNGTETINGATTLVVADGTSATVICNGSAFFTREIAGQKNRRNTHAGNYTILPQDKGDTQEFSAAATASLTAAATMGNGWFGYIRANGGNVTIDPDGSETIEGATTYTVPNGATVFIHTDGTAWYVVAQVRTDAAHPDSPLATTSGSSILYENIPSGIKVVELTFASVSLDGTNSIDVQIGDSGGIETSGYSSATSTQGDTAFASDSFIIAGGGGAEQISGTMRLRQVGTNEWIASYNMQLSTSNNAWVGAGSKTLSGGLTQIQVSPSGADDFDNGAIALNYP